MATQITLASQRLQVFIGGELANSITYTNIDTINRIKEEVRVPGQWPMTSGLLMQPPVIGSTTYNWVLEIVMRDQRKEYIRLGDLTGDGSTWTNNAAGYAIAEAAIYTAFP